MVILGGRGVSYERGTPVVARAMAAKQRARLTQSVFEVVLQK